MLGELADDLRVIELETYAAYSGILGVEVEAYRRARAEGHLGPSKRHRGSWASARR